ncbi:MAG: DUF3971 domain-containing protein [Gammaproteobacteria bacterium]|nr:DUF3971 domain-containing protein [Gammaproteobacteria bacterium]
MAKVDPNNFLYRFYGWIWTLVVTLLVLAAVTLTVVRLILPYTEGYRTDLEDSLSKSLGQKVSVGSMTAELNGLSPTLVLEDLKIYDAGEKDVQFKLARMGIGFSIRKSLQEEKAIPVNLYLSGTELRIVREKDLTYSINGIGVKVDSSTEVNGDTYPPVLKWLFENARLSVDQVHVDYLDRSTDKHITFQATEISLKNSGSRHQIDGVLLLSEDLVRQTGFSVDIEATDMQDISSWKISTFALAHAVDLEKLQKTFFSAQKLKTQGLASIRLWSTWQGLKPVSFYGNINVTEFQLDSDAQRTPFRVEQVNSRFHLQHDSTSQWMLDVEKLELLDKAIVREPARIRIGFNTQSKSIEAQASLLYVQDIRKFLQVSEFVDAEQYVDLNKLALSGEIRDLYLSWKQPQNKSVTYDLAFRTRDLSAQAWKKIPRFSGLDAVVWMDENSGSSMVSSRSMQLDIAHVFRYPWAINSLNGLLQWRKHDGTWHVMSEHLAVDGRDADMVARMHLILANDKLPGYLDLLARFDNTSVSELKRFYPVNVMKPTLVSWLDRALQSGSLHDGGVVYRGWLTKGAFPFREKQGKFEVDFKAEKLSLSYLEKWPDFHDIQADINFAVAGMHIATSSATVQGMSVKSFTAHIDEFRQPWLELNGHIQGKTAQALDFIHQSPLNESLSKQVRQMKVSGDSVLDLAMSIPLRKDLGTTRYRGELELKDSTLYSRFGDGRLAANSVYGTLLFTEQGYYSDSIQGKVFSQPAQLNVSTEQLNNGRLISLELQGRAHASELQNELKIGLLDSIEGESLYKTRLSMRQGAQQETLLTIKSDMQGMAINLPHPLYKSAESRQDFSALWNANTQQFQFSLGKNIHSVFWLDNSGETTLLRRGDLHFGPGMPHIPDSDVLRLSGRLENFPLSSWMTELSHSKSANGLSVKLPWELDLDYMGVLAVEEVDGVVMKKVRKPNPASLPILRVNIQQLEYKELKLGRFTLNADPFNSGYKIDALNFDGPMMSFSSKGYWQQGDSPLTALSIHAHARNAEALLSKLGFDSPIQGGDLQLNGDIRWPGSPDKFVLKAVEGKLAFNIKNGRLLNVEPGAGRVLGLLSFQALPRRLALDFRDIFGKGYRFDSIQGEFNIEDGNARTRNMTILSSSARVFLSGRIGLEARDYDQDVIVALGDGSSYFVAGALAGGIQTGVVLWVMEKVLDVDKNSRLLYKITGSWEDPVVSSIN